MEVIDETTGEVLDGILLRRSPSIGAIAEALAKAQAEITAAEKSQSNPAFKRGNKESRYADLAAVYDACRLPLANHGIAVVQSPSANGAYVTVTTLLAHASGEWFEGALTMRSRDESPHGLGGCITYARRYALSALAGVAPADDDGNQASGKSAPAVPPLVVEAPKGPPPAGYRYIVRSQVDTGISRHGLEYQWLDLAFDDGTLWRAEQGPLMALLQEIQQQQTPVRVTKEGKTAKGFKKILSVETWKPAAGETPP